MLISIQTGPYNSGRRSRSGTGCGFEQYIKSCRPACTNLQNKLSRDTVGYHAWSRTKGLSDAYADKVAASAPRQHHTYIQPSLASLSLVSSRTSGVTKTTVSALVPVSRRLCPSARVPSMKSLYSRVTKALLEGGSIFPSVSGPLSIRLTARDRGSFGKENTSPSLLDARPWFFAASSANSRSW